MTNVLPCDYFGVRVCHKRRMKDLADFGVGGQERRDRRGGCRSSRVSFVGYFEPWNQQRFDPSEPYIARVQWRRAYQSYRANQAHPHQNIGV